MLRVYKVGILHELVRCNPVGPQNILHLQIQRLSEGLDTRQFDKILDMIVWLRHLLGLLG